MALIGVTTDYQNLDQLPAYEPAFITVDSNATGVEAVRFQVREKANPSGSFSTVSQMLRQADINTTDTFTFNFAAIAEDRLSAADDPLLYGYPNGVTYNEWKQYQFRFDELSRNANDQLVETESDVSWDGLTGFTDESPGTLCIHYASWHDVGNQYYLRSLTDPLVSDVSFGFANNTTPTHTGGSNVGRFLTDLTGVTMSEPWSFTLDYLVNSAVSANFKLSYRHTLSAVVYDREVTGLTVPSDDVERQRVQAGLKDLVDNSNYTIANQVLTAWEAGDDDGAELLLRFGSVSMTDPKYKLTVKNKSGCRKAALEWVNPYGAVDIMEFAMKGDDLFMSEGELWEKSNYESFSTVHGSHVKYPQMLQRQRQGSYILELESEPLPINYGHLVLKQMMVAPKAWVQVQLGKGGFTRSDEAFTQSNITGRIPVVLEFDEEQILVNRKGDGYFTISVRAMFSRKQTGQRT